MLVSLSDPFFTGVIEMINLFLYCIIILLWDSSVAPLAAYKENCRSHRSHSTLWNDCLVLCFWEHIEAQKHYSIALRIKIHTIWYTVVPQKCSNELRDMRICTRCVNLSLQPQGISHTTFIWTSLLRARHCWKLLRFYLFVFLCSRMAQVFHLTCIVVYGHFRMTESMIFKESVVKISLSCSYNEKWNEIMGSGHIDIR